MIDLYYPTFSLRMFYGSQKTKPKKILSLMSMFYLISHSDQHSDMDQILMTQFVSSYNMTHCRFA